MSPDRMRRLDFARPPAPRGIALAGRDAELAHLDAEFTAAARGEFRCVLVLGEPGVGKSRLAEEFLSRHGADAIGLRARGYPMGAAVAFGMWTEAFTALLHPLSDDDVAALCAGFVDPLAEILPRIASIRSNPAASSRHALLGGVAGLLTALVSRRPVIVVFDDVQLADPSSWEALRYVARSLVSAPILVLCVLRPGELLGSEAGASVVFELEQDGLCSRLELGPLPDPGLRQLATTVIGNPAPQELVSWVQDRSRGNALFAIGLLRALVDEQADLTAPRLRRLPEGLAEQVIRRTRGLEESTRSMLELLAVAGRPVGLVDLLAMSGRPLDDLEADLTALVRARTVVEEERERELSYAILHPLVRDAVYQDIGGARRRLLHRQAGRALALAGRSAEAAVHLARSADVGDAEAIDALLLAVRHAEQREAYREALELLGELVEILPAGDERWRRVYEAVSWRAEWVVDHRADSHVPVGIAAMRAIDALFERAGEDVERRASVKFRLASFLAWGAGDLAEAEAMCRQAKALFAQAGDQHQALLVARELAWLRGLQGDFAGMAADAAAVVRAADAMGDRFVAMQGLHALGYAAVFRGRFAEAEPAIRRAVALAAEDGKSYRLTTALGMFAVMHSAVGRAPEALAVLDEAKAGNPDYRLTILVEQEVQTRWWAGNYRAAVALALEVIARSPQSTSRRRVVGLVCGALCAVETGEARDAERLLTRAHASLGGRDWSVFNQYADYAGAMLDRLDGRPDECRRGLRTVANELIEMDAGFWCAPVLADLVEVAVETDQAAVAERAASELTAMAEAVGTDVHAGLAATATAWARRAAGHRFEAAASARAGIELLSGTGCHGHLGRAHHLLGQVAQDRSETVASLQQAVRLFDEGGAAGRRALALEHLRTHGSAGRRAAAAALGPGSLSRREREVARLAATGLSARDIAERLVVSTRTVESHLSSAYGKLGVASKLDLVRRADELDL